MPTHKARPGRESGISMVEIMVALVIGLVSVLVLMQVGIAFEDQKRTTVGSSNAADAGGVSLHLLRRAIAEAGFGLNDPDAIGCTLHVHRESDGTDLPATTLLPADIVQGADGAPDVLNVRAGNSRRFAETGLFSVHAGDDTDFVTDSNFGFPVGDVFLIAERDNPDCVIAEVSGIENGNSTDIRHQAGATRYNKPGGSGIAFGGNARLLNLGRQPALTRFAVVNGRLQLAELLTGNTINILENVITFQAQYGFNDSVNGLTWSDNVIDADHDGTVGDDDDWLRLHAMRVVVLLRHEKMERPGESGECEASPATIALPGGFGTFDVSALPGGRCYRYRVAETVAPLRNVIWNGNSSL